MVPIYALNSWIVLKFPQTSIYLDTIRECYEAFVIYNFMMYLCNFLKYEVENIETIQEAKQDIKWFYILLYIYYKDLFFFYHFINIKGFVVCQVVSMAFRF